MFIVIMTGSENMWARDVDHAITYAMDYARPHGPYSDMEDWPQEAVENWIRRDLERSDRHPGYPLLDLYISGPEGHSFTVYPE